MGRPLSLSVMNAVLSAAEATWQGVYSVSSECCVPSGELFTVRIFSPDGPFKWLRRAHCDGSIQVAINGVWQAPGPVAAEDVA